MKEYEEIAIRDNGRPDVYLSRTRYSVTIYQGEPNTQITVLLSEKQAVELAKEILENFE